MTVTRDPRRPDRAVVLVLVLLATWLAGPAAADNPWTVDVARSHLVVHALAAGLLSPVLHDHHLTPERWSGTIAFAPERLPDVGLTITIAADSFRNRQPELSPEDLETVETQVRGAGVLHAADHPEIVYRAERVDVEERWAAEGMEGLRGTLAGQLTLRGQSRPLAVPVVAQWSGDRLRATGRASLRQTDFGIEPYRRFLGTVAVRDEVLVEFTIEAVRDP
jgi:polyisoprenoid-binding protein YceI